LWGKKRKKKIARMDHLPVLVKNYRKGRCVTPGKQAIQLSLSHTSMDTSLDNGLQLQQWITTF